MAKAKTATAKEMELNCWCIEQAVKWPTIYTPSATSGGIAWSSGGGGGQTVDADVLGRADALLRWVRVQH